MVSASYVNYIHISDYNVKIHETMKRISESASHIYETVFLDISIDVEVTLNEVANSENTKDALLEKLKNHVNGSYYISSMTVIYEDGSWLSSNLNPTFELSSLSKYFAVDGTQLFQALKKGEDSDNIFYAINKTESPNGENALLIVELDYSLINNTVKPESISYLAGYMALISIDGDYIYHKDPNLIGKNIYNDIFYIQEITQMEQKDIKVITDILEEKTSRTRKENYKKYSEYGVEKICHYKKLESFQAVTCYIGNLTAIDKWRMKRVQIEIVIRSLILLLVVLVLIRYVYLMKYTDYFTEVENERAFRKALQKHSKKGKMEQYLLLKIDSILDQKERGIQHNDSISNALSNYLKSLNKLYSKFYRISIDHYLFVLNEQSVVENKDLLQKLRSKIVHNKDHEIYIRGKVLFVDMDIIQELECFDVDATLIKYMQTTDNHITESKPIEFISFRTILEQRKTKAKQKNILESAIRNNKIIPFYQPILDLKTSQVLKNEVLMRIDYEGDYCLPGPFIKIAEEEALAEKLDRVMIRNAFRYYHKWFTNTGKGVPLSINLSGKSINEGMIEFILEYSLKAKVQKNQITFELTETAALDNMENAIKHLLRLREAGFKLAIDDFGTGYAHIELLSKLPVDYIKIDGSFVKNVHNSQTELKTLSALVYLAQNYNAEVIAEFVENEKIIEILNSLQVEYGQGFYFSTPEKEPVLSINKIID